jgi:hypothetical protein
MQLCIRWWLFLFIPASDTGPVTRHALVPGLPGALPGNPAAQERVPGASLLALAIADTSHPFEFSGPTYYANLLGLIGYAQSTPRTF